MVDLAPCPKCGHRAEIRQDPPLFNGHKGYFVVCGYANCVRQVGNYGTEEAAALDWNRGRRLPEELSAILRKAQQAVESFYKSSSEAMDSTGAKR